MTTDLYIGPLIGSSGEFAYDTFSEIEGLRSSFRYQRIEQARYDRRAMIAELRLDQRLRVQVCDTLAEFEQQVAEAQKRAENRGDAAPAEG